MLIWKSIKQGLQNNNDEDNIYLEYDTGGTLRDQTSNQN